MKKSWYEKYGHEEQGIGFVVLEDLLQIGYSRHLNENYVYTFGYLRTGNNIFKKIINLVLIWFIFDIKRAACPYSSIGRATDL